MGSRETVGARSEFAAGAQIGDENQFGRKIKFGRRISIGEKNQFGFKDEFGSNDQIGQKNEFGRGDVFGSKVLLYKKQQFGPRNAFHKSVYLSGDLYEFSDLLLTAPPPLSPLSIYTQFVSVHHSNRAFQTMHVLGPVLIMCPILPLTMMMLSDVNPSGFDSFGEKDWGLDTDKMPKSDLADWNNMEVGNMAYIDQCHISDIDQDKTGASLHTKR